MEAAVPNPRRTHNTFADIILETVRLRMEGAVPNPRRTHTDFADIILETVRFDDTLVQDGTRRLNRSPLVEISMNPRVEEVPNLHSPPIRPALIITREGVRRNNNISPTSMDINRAETVTLPPNNVSPAPSPQGPPIHNSSLQESPRRKLTPEQKKVRRRLLATWSPPHQQPSEKYCNPISLRVTSTTNISPRKPVTLYSTP